MPNLFLSPHELKEMTGKVQAQAQYNWLCRSGFFCKLSNGRVLLSRDHVLSVMNPTHHKNRAEPDFGALDQPT